MIGVAMTHSERDVIASPSAAPYRVVLRPRRSANGRLLVRLMVVMAVAWGCIGLVFAAVGAWPVTGFMGLEVLLLGAALMVHHRGRRAFESLVLDDGGLTVRQVSPRGEDRTWSLSPHWLRVRVHFGTGTQGGIELRSRGEAVLVGSFLAPEERTALASELRRALVRLSTPPSGGALHA